MESLAGIGLSQAQRPRENAFIGIRLRLYQGDEFG
jgi:hypothetical protein